MKKKNQDQIWEIKNEKYELKDLIEKKTKKNLQKDQG
jgi:hypothetical protein